jgi:hypothetical protein
MKLASVCLLLAAAANALQLAPRALVGRTCASVRMVEPTDVDKPAEQLTISDEQIAAAAEKASQQKADPFAGAKVEKREPEPFDPRLIVYVSIPALVLVAQLFFTFSRDMMAGDVVGPAVMDLWIQ